MSTCRLVATFEDRAGHQTAKNYYLLESGDPFFRSVTFLTNLQAVLDVKIVAATLEFDSPYSPSGAPAELTAVEKQHVLSFLDLNADIVEMDLPEVKADFLDVDNEVVNTGAMTTFIDFCLSDAVADDADELAGWADGLPNTKTTAADDLRGAANSIVSDINSTQWYKEDGADVEVLP